MKEFKMKARVKSPEHSKVVQQIMFDSGFDWTIGSGVFNYTDAPFLVVDASNSIKYCENTRRFESYNCKELVVLLFPEDYDAVTAEMLKDENKVIIDGREFTLTGQLVHITANPNQEIFDSRVVNKEDVKVGDIVYKLCMGNIEKVVITSEWYLDKVAGTDLFRVNYTSINDGYVHGHKSKFFAGDFGIGKSDLSLNGVFRTYEDAFKYSITPEYKKKKLEWEAHCSEIFETFDDMIKPSHFPIYSSRDWYFRVSP